MKKYLFILFAVVFMVAAQAVSAQIYSIESPQLPPTIEDIVEDVQPVYTVTVTVIDIFGNEVETPTTTPVPVGQPIEIPTPENTRKPSIFETMPARDVEYTVIYIPDELLNNPNFYLLTIDDYDTPLGLGAMQMNIGHCVE